MLIRTSTGVVGPQAVLPGAWFGRRCAVALAAVAGLALGASALAQPTIETPSRQTPRPSAPAPDAAQNPAPGEAPAAMNNARVWYPVSKVTVEYGSATKPVPEARLEGMLVKLGLTDEGLTSTNTIGARDVEIRLTEVGSAKYPKIDTGGLFAIAKAIQAKLAEDGIIGVMALPDPAQIEGDKPYKDLRKGDTTIKFLVFVFVVREVRSIAANADEPGGALRVNPELSFHQRIRENSPIKSGDAVNKDELDSYIGRLSRHPGRRIDVALSSAPGDEQGAATLDYVVTEGKPWMAYFQLSNTGTKQTEKWRERFGYLNTQLTGHDDILQLDYTTAGFDKSHAFNGSYELPLADILRFRIFGGYNQYTASDIGQSRLSFKGDGFNVGGELGLEVFNQNRWWIDLIGGIRYDESSTRQAAGNGEGAFLSPYVGLRTERRGDASTFGASAIFEFANGQDNDFTTLQRLGRLNPDDNWTLFKFDATGSLYLEPLLFPDEFRRGDDFYGATVAHELWASLRGQYAFGDRLIPTTEYVLGGYSTVRGYPESVLAGDSAIVGSAEYRFHVPRVFREVGKGRPGKSTDFRFAPAEPWGVADWDLILRAFVDVGRIENSKREVFEINKTIAGTGIGAELQIKSYLNARLDWGFALTDLNTGVEKVESGDNRLHFVLTLSF